jgi:hypothetical protein
MYARENYCFFPAQNCIRTPLIWRKYGGFTSWKTWLVEYSADISLMHFVAKNYSFPEGRVQILSKEFVIQILISLTEE